MYDNILVDNINIKTLPELIISYLKENDINSNINNLRKFYSFMLSNISIEIKDSYLNKIQKYLSANESCQILIFDDINEGIYDKELKNSCNKIVEIINRSNNNTSFYKEIMNKCYFIHFNENELKTINNSFKSNDYNSFMFYLFKHAINNYKISTPKILAQRIYDDAITLANEYPIRKNLFKIAADLGNSYAALQYGLSLDSENNSESLIYYLKGKDLDTCLWKIGYIIEHFLIDKNQLEYVKKELKDIINYSNDYDECDNLCSPRTKTDFEKECIFTSFKIYFFLAKKKNFSKGYNSIGKFLINNKIAYINKKNIIDDEISKSKGIEYLKKGVSLSNIYAMENLAIYYRKNNINNELIKPLLLISAENEDLISCVELSKLLIKEDKINEAVNYLKYASSLKSAYAQHNLAKIYENKFDYDNAKYWYREAIKNGNINSAINLAQLYFKEYVDDNTNMKNSYLMYAIDILDRYIEFLNEDNKKISLKLVSEWKKLI